MFIEIKDYVNAWKDGKIYEVLDNLRGYWHDPEITKDAKIVWFMRLSHHMSQALNRRSGYGDFDWFLKEFEDTIRTTGNKDAQV